MKFLNDIDNKAGAARSRSSTPPSAWRKTGNNEVAFRFYRAAAHAGYRDIRPPLQAFLMSVGRQKFVVPLYAALRANPEDRPGPKRLQGGARALPPGDARQRRQSRWQAKNNKGTEECNT
jgi:leukotriene-A4 hydrolase